MGKNIFFFQCRGALEPAWVKACGRNFALTSGTIAQLCASALKKTLGK